MKLFIQAKPGSKKPGIEKIDATNWIVRVRAPAVDGKANEAIRKAVATELGLAPGLLEWKRGTGSRKKTLEIPDEALNK